MKKAVFMDAWFWIFSCLMSQLANGQTTNEVASGVFRVGSLKHPGLIESSGLSYSPTRPGIFWTHNDTGSPAFLFAIDQSGRHIGAYEVQGAQLIDWEAVTTYRGFLYLADTGTNGMVRSHSAIHKVREPDLQKSWGPAPVVQTWFIRFPNGREDCESLFILNNFCYLIAKYPMAGSVSLYRFNLSNQAESILLERVAMIPISSPVSDAAISADTRRLGLVSEDGVSVVFIEGDPGRAATAERREIEFKNDSIEGGVFTIDGFLTTAETIPDILLFDDPHLEGAPIFMTPLVNVTEFVGGVARFNAAAAGFPAPTFEWRFNGNVIAGQTNSSLILSNLTLADAGSYEIMAINSAGQAVSRGALLVLEKVVDLKITEVMPSKNPNPLPTADWWELTSFSTDPVDLSGWRFNDSLGGFQDAFVLPGRIMIQPGESIVFVEDLTRDQFLDWWGRSNFTADVQIISYSGSALSFRAEADSLRLWRPNAQNENDLAARVDFVSATEGVTFGFDPVLRVFGDLSQEGVNGAFRAASGGDIGSPGRIDATLELRVSKTSEGVAVSVSGESGLPFVLEESFDLAGWNSLATNRIQIEPGLTGSRFFRIRPK